MASPSSSELLADGVHQMVPRDRMAPSARKLRDIYAITPGAPFLQREFGWYSLEAWKEQGMPADVPLAELFHFDPPGHYALTGLGWCEAAFDPPFEEKVLEDRGDHELVQDQAGRAVLCFKGRRSGFMPEYVDHPVKDLRTWEENCRWRLDPKTASRYPALTDRLAQAAAAAGRGLMIQQWVIGAYMYLRSLIGPEEVLYAFHDQPELIHSCLRTWLELALAVTAWHQRQVTFDEIYFGEDICYNHGPLISPDMMREFLFPYYQELISAVRARQIDRSRHLFVGIDSDGYVVPVIEVYREIGMDVMNPFEVASGCDVVEIGRRFPWLVMTGGIDKRVLAQGRDAIDRHLDRILPAMRARGGYIPTCDHGVPAEVPYTDYLHYRKRCLEFAE